MCRTRKDFAQSKHSKQGKMVLVNSFPSSTDGIRHVQANTRVFSESKCFGTGTLYITESALYWLSSPGRGISILYPSMRASAISMHRYNFQDPCFFVLSEERIG
ncbi:hypothetical protein TNCV_5071281 [Trichonephila clavipes]|nr:hypothetical protein TNCV_5071281 [Trichonephila clavipes]